jgi:hypothetical protein
VQAPRGRKWEWVQLQAEIGYDNVSLDFQGNHIGTRFDTSVEASSLPAHGPDDTILPAVF